MCRVYDKSNKKELSVFVGDVFCSKQGSKAVVIKYANYKEVTIRFLDVFGSEMVLQVGRLKSGVFKNPHCPSVCGVGYLGVGEYLANDSTYSRHVYNKWKSMIIRVHSEEYLVKRPSYRGCSMQNSWYDFQVFAKWFNEQSYCKEGYQLDKDVLLKGNKHYSEETCCLVPSEINTLILDRAMHRGQYPVGVYKNNNTGKFVAQSCSSGERYLGTFPTPEEAFYSYKEAKEQHIKSVANKWKGKIEDKAYQALMSYQIDIDD